MQEIGLLVDRGSGSYLYLEHHTQPKRYDSREKVNDSKYNQQTEIVIDLGMHLVASNAIVAMVF